MKSKLTLLILAVLILSQCSKKPRELTLPPFPSPSPIVTPEQKPAPTVTPTPKTQPQPKQRAGIKPVATDAPSLTKRVLPLPLIHGGDKVVMPGGAIFTVPLGTNARVKTIEGKTQIELTPAPDEHPQNISTTDNQGLRTHVYFGGETVAGFYVEPGYFLILNQGKPPIYAECMKLAPCPECGPRVKTKFVSDPSCREDRVRFNR